MVLSSARQSLVAALRPADDPARMEPFSGATPEDWREVVRLARLHRLSALLYDRLKIVKDLIPVEILQILRKDYLWIAERNVRLFHKLAGILEHFHHARIPVIPLKGAYLAEHVYGNIALRPMGDVDLLVREQDLMRARDILLNMGFDRTELFDEVTEETKHFHYWHSEHELCVEVHWNLTIPSDGIHPDIGALWERSRPALIKDVPVREMSPEDLVLHLCVHTSNHLFDMGLRAMCDLSETLAHFREELDWDCLFKRARQWGAGRCVYVNLRLAGELLNVPVPAGLPDGTALRDSDEGYLSFAGECLFVSAEEPEKAWREASGLARMLIEDGIVGKLLSVWRGIFLPRHVMAFLYPVSPHSWRIFLYYPVRVKDMLKRNGRMAFGLLAGEKRTVSRAERQRRIEALRKWLSSG